jgi:survival-of-motor-neuron-related-splicing factor 30
LALNPDNAEFIELKTIVESGIQEYEVELAKLLPKVQPSAPPPPSAETAPAPKWSVENHPAYQGTGRKLPTQADTPEPVRTYHVNEKVQARYKGKFYTARILAVTGSSKDPKFTIKFDGWPDTPTLGLSDLKPIAAPVEPQQVKRKADEPPPPPSSTHTYSAAANVNPELATQAKKEPSKVSDGPPKPPKMAKKLKNNKTYEKSANDWKAFNSKMAGKGKMGKKESMFRTGEGVNARGLYKLSLVSSFNANIVQSASRAAANLCEVTLPGLSIDTSRSSKTMTIEPCTPHLPPNILNNITHKCGSLSGVRRLSAAGAESAHGAIERLRDALGASCYVFRRWSRRAYGRGLLCWIAESNEVIPRNHAATSSELDG